MWNIWDPSGLLDSPLPVRLLFSVVRLALFQSNLILSHTAVSALYEGLAWSVHNISDGKILVISGVPVLSVSVDDESSILPSVGCSTGLAV